MSSPNARIIYLPAKIPLDKYPPLRYNLSKLNINAMTGISNLQIPSEKCRLVQGIGIYGRTSPTSGRLKAGYPVTSSGRQRPVKPYTSGGF